MVLPPPPPPSCRLAHTPPKTAPRPTVSHAPSPAPLLPPGRRPQSDRAARHPGPHQADLLHVRPLLPAARHVVARHDVPHPLRPRSAHASSPTPPHPHSPAPRPLATALHPRPAALPARLSPPRSHANLPRTPPPTLCPPFSGAVFAWLSNSEEGYDYHFLVKYLTGFSTATPLYFLFIAAFTRPLFTAERLNYHREFKSGISSFGYFYAKNLYNFSLLPFLAMSFSIALYIFAPPVQWFSSYFFTAFFSAWCGGRAHAPSPLPHLTCLFSPLPPLHPPASPHPPSHPLPARPPPRPWARVVSGTGRARRCSSRSSSSRSCRGRWC